MSTRAQVIITDESGDQLWFYRHSDGYPDGALPSLKQFITWVKEGKIRDNVEQAAGWLVMIGAKEYGKVHDWKNNTSRNKTIKELFEAGEDWKVGAYEPSVPIEHGDIEYLYTLDLKSKTITYKDIYKGTTHTA
jgi:hypothetical protein